MKVPAKITLVEHKYVEIDPVLTVKAMRDAWLESIFPGHYIGDGDDVYIENGSWWEDHEQYGITTKQLLRSATPSEPYTLECFNHIIKLQEKSC